jgi:hypothetical protein
MAWGATLRRHHTAMVSFVPIAMMRDGRVVWLLGVHIKGRAVHAHGWVRLVGVGITQTHGRRPLRGQLVNTVSHRSKPRCLLLGRKGGVVMLQLDRSVMGQHVMVSHYLATKGISSMVLESGTRSLESIAADSV